MSTTSEEDKDGFSESCIGKKMAVSPAINWIPFPPNASWFIHFDGEHLFEYDENRKCVRHAAIAQTTEDLVASVTRSMLRELCQDVINKAIFAKTSSIYDALEHEVVSDVVRRDVEIIHKQKLFQAIAVSFGDAVMYETCRELVEVSINEMQRIARENAMEEVASGIFADVESAIIMDVCTNAWEDAQPKNSFHMLSLPEKRIRKKPHH